MEADGTVAAGYFYGVEIFRERSGVANEAAVTVGVVGVWFGGHGEMLNMMRWC